MGLAGKSTMCAASTSRAPVIATRNARHGYGSPPGLKCCSKPPLRSVRMQTSWSGLADVVCHVHSLTSSRLYIQAWSDLSCVPLGLPADATEVLEFEGSTRVHCRERASFEHGHEFDETGCVHLSLRLSFIPSYAGDFVWFIRCS